MTMFRKKAVLIEARLNDGTPETILALQEWIIDSGGNAVVLCRKRGGAPDALIISAKNEEIWSMADREVLTGDWVVKDGNGKFYPCHPELFEKRYESAE